MNNPLVITDRTAKFEQHLAKLGDAESQHVYAVQELATDLAKYAVTRGTMNGPALPWPKSHGTIRFKPGQISIWAGVNGHGKSLLLGQAALWWLKARQTVLVASLEMKPAETMYRMARQMRGGMFPVDYFEHFTNTLTDLLWIYDQTDSVASDRILGLVHWAATDLKADHVIIDSLVKCGLTRDDYSQQAKFVDRLQWAAKRHGIHVHLVCHMRKGENEHHRAGKFDIRGAAEISDLADNVLVVFRNKAKEDAKSRQQNGYGLTPSEHEQLAKPDTMLRIDKNRENGFEETFGLWYHQGAMQFLGADTPHAMEWEMDKPEWHGAAERARQQQLLEEGAE